MVCCSPVGYGVLLTFPALALRRSRLGFKFNRFIIAVYTLRYCHKTRAVQY